MLLQGGVAAADRDGGGVRDVLTPCGDDSRTTLQLYQNLVITLQAPGLGEELYSNNSQKITPVALLRKEKEISICQIQVEDNMGGAGDTAQCTESLLACGGPGSFPQHPANQDG